MTTISNDALVEELMRTEGKAEIVNGEVVEITPTGFEPGFAADEIFAFLRDYVRNGHEGLAVADNKGFLCDLPNRGLFSPDAAYYTGPLPGMRFFPQAPVFAVEVRSENDYGRRAERDILDKIADYFSAGTLVVWDVDLRNEEVVTKYTPETLNTPQVFKRGELANAEPAVPGWSMPVDALFPPVKNEP